LAPSVADIYRSMDECLEAMREAMDAGDPSVTARDLADCRREYEREARYMESLIAAGDDGDFLGMEF